MELIEFVSYYNSRFDKEGGFNPVVVTTNPKIKCPHCSEVLVDYNTDSDGRVYSRIALTRKEGTETTRVDGVTIPLQETLEFVDNTRFDSRMLIGKCLSCDLDYYVIVLYLSSRPVNIKIDDKEMDFIVMKPL